MALLGHVGTLTHRRVVGWAWETEAPDDAVTVLVAIERRVLGRCRADRYSDDLVVEGVGDGRHAFALDLPARLLSPRRAYEISVRREEDGLHLPGSPYVLEPAVRIVR
ncbi:hypothetical protein Q8W71_29625 [Methylobacterium sp. NEAU 140]|uniref:hypothetical protein n=1 Tax=Methylobacterium sp. NEAU 140 TaxID=3064945 RepID=UPI00273774A8|nr:hypothetical protein [Methylobacterium sp. NEAU 140]MDP4026770.1 hypothetical protein [Methylobacterium sp. NEAU 140]